MQKTLTFVCLAIALSVMGCLPPTNPPNYLQQAMQQNRLNQQHSAQKLTTYTKKLSPLIKACNTKFTANMYDKAVCVGNAQILTSNEVGFQTHMRSLIAESAALRLDYAKKIDSGVLSQAEAETLYLIDFERLKSGRVAQAKAENNKSLAAIRQHSANFPRDTTCRKSGESINCTTW